MSPRASNERAPARPLPVSSDGRTGTRRLAIRAGLMLVAHLAVLGCVDARQRADDELASRISRAVLASDELNLSRIDVTAEQGTVYLSGMADDHESKTHAETEARNFRGVKKVINKIEVDF